eukprot:4765204-Prymnesium_polylepis.1
MVQEAAEEGARQPAVERAQVQPTARAEQRAGEPEHAAGRASAEQVRAAGGAAQEQAAYETAPWPPSGPPPP